MDGNLYGNLIDHCLTAQYKKSCFWKRLVSVNENE